ncbi:MAG: CBS and ACT domain-containing protein [Syntrophomonas sp.]|uniref:CBS and ACT domain-containing protein n=1 Tax=Syntrophomonas sp. TaxID=2053627 RepID=UPI0026119488|nr:CBS and ACT domain-containing protein [Syntrophomonas sp.]MDD3879883.1 CBS and ACT domain-containing protein [Syntrophomonas sp.]MDD4627377.1 CBS and ACT domain-containing protein [Syntrophomonas sp.]
MKVKDRMTPNPYATTPDTCVGELWHSMQEKSLQRVPVLDRGKLIGIVTRRDFNARPELGLKRSSLATRFFPEEIEQKLSKLRVRDIIPLSQQLITIHQDAFIEQAAKLLRDNRISGLPVIDDEGRMVGIITQSDLSDAFLYILGVNCRGTRLCLRVDDDAQVLLRLGEVLSRFKVKIESLVRMEVKDEQSLLIIRLDTVDSRSIVEEIKAAGFQLESVIIKQ